MLYLVETQNYYKVGYSNNVNNRIKVYGKESKLILTREGDYIDEQMMHYKLSKYRIKGNE